jgi:hypothetical protein
MKKEIFHLREPQADPYLIKSDSSENLILWTIRLYDHVLIMPELTILVQEFYCFN